jgi:hypothetical protein
MLNLKTVSFGLLVSLAAVGAHAQSGIKSPDSVGVTPEAAAEANQKAVPRSDTGTVVRTAPPVTDRARDTTVNPGATTANTAAEPATSPAPRRARADRN